MNIYEISNIISQNLKQNYKFRHSGMHKNEYIVYDWECNDFFFKSVKYFDCIEWFISLKDLVATDWEFINMCEHTRQYVNDRGIFICSDCAEEQGR